ncbi:MAG: ribonuclease H family protein [Bacteroidales bacterium]|nr:ribonuclease H family protein [Bacteroidales bacterium]
MSAKKSKYYVVWEGNAIGIFDNWDDCKISVSGFDGAKYKSFGTREEAEKAFTENPFKHIGSQAKKNPPQTTTSTGFIRESIAVDAACSGNPGKMEYRGVFVPTGEQLFHVGPMEQGTNNIGEFLAIVHGLAFLKQQNSTLPLYSDSKNAITWVKNKHCKTKLTPVSENQEIFNLIARAEKWLHENHYSTTILKWETEEWGEIPADFGRK